ncbi:MAG: hypothetical protein WA865_10765, partial [Spirulinaceae cyanobacterium]
SLTVRAYKGKEGTCLERNQAVIYKGPWKQVVDDDGHTFYRGKPMAVCDKTFQILTNSEGAYGQDIIAIEPYEEISLEAAKEFKCKTNAIRHPKESKGSDYQLTMADTCC